MELSGKRVLVVGASGGVGFAAAEQFARAGAGPIALTARGVSGLEKAAATVRSYGAAAHVIPGDLTVRSDVERVVAEAVERLGGLDVLAICAAGVVFGHFDEVSADDFDQAVRASFTGQTDFMRAALPHVERGWGRIVVVSSLMAKTPLPTLNSYAAAKHAQRGLLGSVRAELLAEGSPVSISLVTPGAIDTPMWRTMSSATGRLPRRPPDAYSAATIGRAAVAVAIKPRREITIGLEGRSIELLWTYCRPAGDLLLRAVDLYYSSGRREARPRGHLWQAADAGKAYDLRRGRPSLWGIIRLGRRLIPGT